MRTEGYELLRYYRSEIRFESEMLNARASAFLTSQSFLVIAYTASLVGLRADWQPWLLLVLPTSLALLGLILAGKARPGIAAAAQVIAGWRRKQEELLNSDPGLAERCRLSIAISKDPLEPLRRGTRFAVQTPTIFLVAWCFFACLPILVIIVLLR